MNPTEKLRLDSNVCDNSIYCCFFFSQYSEFEEVVIEDSAAKEQTRRKKKQEEAKLKAVVKVSWLLQLLTLFFTGR